MMKLQGNAYKLKNCAKSLNLVYSHTRTRTKYVIWWKTIKLTHITSLELWIVLSAFVHICLLFKFQLVGIEYNFFLYSLDVDPWRNDERTFSFEILRTTVSCRGMRREPFFFYFKKIIIICPIYIFNFDMCEALICIYQYLYNY